MVRYAKMVSKEDYSLDSVRFQMVESNLIMMYFCSTRTQINTYTSSDIENC